MLLFGRRVTVVVLTTGLTIVLEKGPPTDRVTFPVVPNAPRCVSVAICVSDLMVLNKLPPAAVTPGLTLTAPLPGPVTSCVGWEDLADGSPAPCFLFLISCLASSFFACNLAMVIFFRASCGLTTTLWASSGLGGPTGFGGPACFSACLFWILTLASVNFVFNCSFCLASTTCG